MAQTLTRLLIHLVFSTKNRAALITPTIEPQLFAYLGAICRTCESPLIEIAGMPDHVHLLILLSKNAALSEFVMTLKKDSSKWIKTKEARFAGFHWQDDYAAFSVSESQLESVRRYIADQKRHHRRLTFQEELVRFLTKYKVEYDPRYIWT